MNTQTTRGIKVEVTTEFQAEYSNPVQNHYVFTYKIRIENNSPYAIQLLRRHWYIHDSIGINREVEGEGVIGQQPVLDPGQIHEYVSGCNLKSGIGKMLGNYLMERIVDGKHFQVEIPEFVMIVPHLNN